MQIAQRAARIEPFYVMEVAKAASALAREVAQRLTASDPDLGHHPLLARMLAEQRHRLTQGVQLN